MKNYNFDEIISREGTNCVKYDLRQAIFNTNDVLPLWVADTDFKTPDFIVESLKNRMEHEIYGYTFKADSYYDSIIGWVKRRHNLDIKKEWILSTSNVVAAITKAIETFTDIGDGIIVQPPVYFPFFHCVKGTNRKLIENPLKIENGRYTFDFEDLKSKINANTKALLLCNPQNPGGTVWTQAELETLTSICLENNILIISDEIHSDLVFSGNQHIPIISISQEVADNSIVCMSPSKTFNVAGLASSFVIIPNEEKKIKYDNALKVGHLDMGNIFGSLAMETAYAKGDAWLNELLDYLWNNYLFLEGFIKENMPKLKVMKPDATYLVWLDFREYGMNSDDLLKFTVEKAKVGLNNGAIFGSGGEGYLRLNIGCPKSVLKEGLERLAEAFKEL